MKDYIVHIEKALFSLPTTPKGAADMGCMIYINDGTDKASADDAEFFKSQGFHEKQLANGKWCYFSFETHKAHEVARAQNTKVKAQPVMFVWNLTKEDLKNVDLTWAERHWADRRELTADQKYPYKK